MTWEAKAAQCERELLTDLVVLVNAVRNASAPLPAVRSPAANSFSLARLLFRRVCRRGSLSLSVPAAKLALRYAVRGTHRHRPRRFRVESLIGAGAWARCTSPKTRGVGPGSPSSCSTRSWRTMSASVVASSKKRSSRRASTIRTSSRRSLPATSSNRGALSRGRAARARRRRRGRMPRGGPSRPRPR